MKMDGYRILDLSLFLPGPMLTQMLADNGNIDSETRGALLGDSREQDFRALLRALRFFDGFRGENVRPWLLSIVRNACYSSHRRQRVRQAADFDETVHGEDTASPSPRQNRRTASRYLPFHSVHFVGKLPTW